MTAKICTTVHLILWEGDPSVTIKDGNIVLDFSDNIDDMDAIKEIFDEAIITNPITGKLHNENSNVRRNK